MKTVILAIILVTLSIDALTQGVFSNATNIALEKVIQDYPNRFRNIKGAVLLENAQATNYESSVKIPGSLSCIVSQSNARNREVLSWKADLFTSADFGEARQKYAELFNQIKNTIIKFNGSKPYILTGQYTSPDEARPFHAVVFNMLPATGDLQKVKVEISLEQQGTNWKLQLAIYDDREEQFVHVQ
jgi:hypothetical protein